MTPMVDLAFLLLTFFVLTTSLNKPLTLQMVMPEKAVETKRPPIPAKRVLTLVLGANNKIHWYSGVDIDQAKTTNFSGNGIRKILIDKKSTVKDLYVIIKPSDKSQYKNVVDILDEMIITEIKQYAIVDLELEDKELATYK